MPKKDIRPNQSEPVIRNNVEKPLGYSLLEGLSSDELVSESDWGMVNALLCNTQNCIQNTRAWPSPTGTPHFDGDDE
ncbi:MAG: hypothetical protein F6K58_04145 [Symploca sp. SIO2E9]|nr:hypothetical protein [Symploca sp. SIO2E9]